MPRLVLSDVSLHYRRVPGPDHGDGPTFVLLHGWACDGGDWDPVVEGLAGLGGVVAVDLRGHGASTVPDSLYTVGEVAADVVALVEALDLDDLVLVGHSAGSEVAVKAAGGLRSRTRAVVTVDPAYGFAVEERPVIREVCERMQTGDPRAVALEYFGRFDTEQTPAHLVEAHRRSAASAHPVAMSRSFAAFAFGPGSLHFRPDADAALADPFLPPVLALYRNVERGAVGAELSHRGDDRVMVFAGSGHWLHQEQPGRFVRAVADWMTTLS